MIYLDNAATTFPKPPQVHQAVIRAMSTCGNPGRSGHEASLIGGRIMLHCREQLAELFHTDDPLRYIFTLNCTDALNLGILGMVRSGGHVICSCLEHNSVLRPLHALMDQQQITCSIIAPEADGRVRAADYAAAIQPNTCLMIVTHASNVTGAIQPVEAICRIGQAHGIPVLIDGAQTAGLVDINLSTLGASLFAMPGHKGLLGPHGCGVLYIAPDFHPCPLRYGGTGSLSHEPRQPEDLPDCYESGTAPLPAIAGLSAGITFIQSHHDANRTREWALRRQLLEGLQSLKGITLYSPPDEDAVGILSFNLLDLDSNAVADHLWRSAGIACRAGLHCAPLLHQHQGTLDRGCVRLSLSCFNTPRDVRRTVEALQELI